MGISGILASIDREIAQLKRVRVLLGGKSAIPAQSARTLGKAAVQAAKPSKKRARRLSPEGRKRIAEAQKQRWAKQKTAADTKQE